MEKRNIYQLNNMGCMQRKRALCTRETSTSLGLEATGMEDHRVGIWIMVRWINVSEKKTDQKRKVASNLRRSSSVMVPGCICAYINAYVNCFSTAVMLYCAAFKIFAIRTHEVHIVKAILKTKRARLLDQTASSSPLYSVDHIEKFRNMFLQDELQKITA